MSLLTPIKTYMHWLHTRWPAGHVEKLPEVGTDGVTSVAGIRVVGDLTGIPLLKFSADTGARAVQAVAKELRSNGVLEQGSTGNVPNPQHSTTTALHHSMLDLAIIGAGVSGIAAALEAKKEGLDFTVFEAVEPFSTIVNFPKGKPIYTYPTEMTPAGQMQFRAEVKEALLEELEQQRKAAGIEPQRERIDRVEKKGDGFLLHRGKDKEPIMARRVIIAIGRSGNYRKLGVTGEHLDKVYNRLYDPKDYAGKNVLVVGGGDSALETTIALAVCGARVTLSYRGKEFSRPKPGNIEKLQMLQQDPMARTGVENPESDRVDTAVDADNVGPHSPGSVTVLLGSNVTEITRDCVKIKDAQGVARELANDVVFVMIGREAPLDFFRRSGIKIRGEWSAKTWVGFVAFFLFCIFLYHWKSGHPHELPIQRWFSQNNWFPFNVSGWLGKPAYGSLLYTLRDSMSKPSFYYTLAYCLCVTVFGIRRIQRRNTPYITWQTITLIAIQCLPLFLLPEIILPWLGRNGVFAEGEQLAWLADQLWERYDLPGYERAWWRSYGFILAFPLNVYNVFTHEPRWMWLGISFLQTFVIIPLLIWRWGKGAYCGWICSCGALAETMGDQQRHKMPHGPVWNRLNMVGQVVLVAALGLLGLRVAGWAMGSGSWPSHAFEALFEGIPFLNYSWSVDLLMAGIIGVGFYFWFSGRVWCRFACPLAALMHVYARFSRFRILPEKSKCISCNVCTSVCHQGIDIMNFANKGMPMEDPECVRCSACVQECPTGVLGFGRLGKEDEWILDKLPASPVRLREERKTRTVE